MKSCLALLFIAFALLLPEFGYPQTGGNVQRFFQTIRLPSPQTVLEHETITTPIVATTNYIKTTYAGNTSAAAVTLTSFTHQPDVPRNLTITPGGTTAHVNNCTIVVSGTDILNKSITENFVFTSTQSTATTGNKAFKTVTSIVWPAGCEASTYDVTWTVGVGSKLGLKRCTTNAGALAWSVFGGAYETTRGTMASDPAVGALNTFIPNGTMDGATTVEVYYSQNFGCY